ncbi:MAG: energy transducer TonB [Bryobacteraceae bacterium]
MLLTWNADSEAVRTASRAVLSIADGNRMEDVDLSLPVFRAGALIYEPVTEHVTLQLRVSSEGTADAIESVGPVGSRGLKVPPVGVDVAGQRPIPLNDMSLAPSSSNPRLFAPPTSAPHSASMPNVSEPPAIEAEGRPAPGIFEPLSGQLPAPPTVAPKPAAPATPRPAAPATAVERAPAPAVMVPAEAAARPAVGPLRVASLKILRHTVIPYPRFARRVDVGGTVTVEVRIGADGHVRDLTVIRGPEMLRMAARGVKDWLFEPPVVDGKPVEAITRVDVSFKPPEKP